MRTRRTLALALLPLLALTAIVLANVARATEGHRSAELVADQPAGSARDGSTTTSSLPVQPAGADEADLLAGRSDRDQASDVEAPRPGEGDGPTPDSPPPVDASDQVATFDLTAPRASQGGPTAADAFAAAPSCSHQCIVKGVAYVQGTDVEIVVETSVRTQLVITVVADLDHDGSYEGHYYDSTAFGYTSHSWVLEDVVPGQTYYVMVAATDSNLYTSHASGPFTVP